MAEVLGAVNEWLATLRWGSTITVAISLAAVAVGLILLFCAWKPGQPNAIVLHVDGSGDVAGSTEFVMTRRSVARLAAGHAELVDGVDSVSATVRSRRITLSVKSQSAAQPARRYGHRPGAWPRVWGCNRCRRSHYRPHPAAVTTLELAFCTEAGTR